MTVQKLPILILPLIFSKMAFAISVPLLAEAGEETFIQILLPVSTDHEILMFTLVAIFYFQEQHIFYLEFLFFFVSFWSS